MTSNNDHTSFSMSESLEDDGYSHSLREENEKYWKLRESENKIRTIYSQEMFNPDIPDLKIPIEHLDQDRLEDLDEKNIFNWRDLEYRKGNLTKIETAETPSIFSRNSEQIVSFLNTDHALVGLLDIEPFKTKFCVCGGSVLKAISGIASSTLDSSDVDFFPVNCSEEQMKEAVAKAISHFKENGRRVNVRRSKYAITIEHSGAIMPFWIEDYSKIFKKAAQNLLGPKPEYYEYWALFRQIPKVLCLKGCTTPTVVDILINMISTVDDSMKTETDLLKFLNVSSVKFIGELISFCSSLNDSETEEFQRVFGDSRKWEGRETFRKKVQFILQNTRTVDEVLCKADIDCSAVAVYNGVCYVTDRSSFALLSGVNVIDPTRQSPTYCKRLRKYMLRGFRVYIPNLRRDQINRFSEDYYRDGCFSGLRGLIWSAPFVPSDYEGNESFVINSGDLFCEEIERRGKKHTFPFPLLYSDYSQNMAGSINQSKRSFYKGAYLIREE